MRNRLRFSSDNKFGGELWQKPSNFDYLEVYDGIKRCVNNKMVFTLNPTNNNNNNAMSTDHEVDHNSQPDNTKLNQRFVIRLVLALAKLQKTKTTVSRHESRRRRPACRHRGGDTTRREHSASITRLVKPLDFLGSAGNLAAFEQLCTKT